MLSATRDPYPATVAFVDDGRWASFYQLAARLRRLGTRVVRLTTVNERQSMLTSRLIFDRCVALPLEGTQEALRAEFARERVIDVQFVETMKDLVSGSLSTLDDEVVHMVRRRIEVMDKEFASRMMVAAGVPTPPRALFSEIEPYEFATAHGFPVVVKDRTGYGGNHVKLAHSEEELAGLAMPYLGSPDAYLEKYIEGEKVNFGAVIGTQGLLEGLCYRTLDWARPFGPSTDIEIYHDPAVFDAGRRAVEAVAVPGLININFMLDAQGGIWAIDLNARVFGGIAAYLACGIDLAAGYLAALGQRPAIERREPAEFLRVKVFPTSLAEVVRIPTKLHSCSDVVEHWS